MTLKEYYKELKSHDWYYAMSDDRRVFNSGYENDKKLQRIKKESPEHEKLFNGFYDHYYSGKIYGTEKVALPKEPKE